MIVSVDMDDPVAAPVSVLQRRTNCSWPYHSAGLIAGQIVGICDGAVFLGQDHHTLRLDTHAAVQVPNSLVSEGMWSRQVLMHRIEQAIGDPERVVHRSTAIWASRICISGSAGLTPFQENVFQVRPRMTCSVQLAARSVMGFSRKSRVS